MVKNLANFLRQNIITVLAVPPLVALGFGFYAKVIRNNVSVDSLPPKEQTKIDTEVLKD